MQVAAATRAFTMASSEDGSASSDALPDAARSLRELRGLLSCLQEDDVELKKLFVRRFSLAWELDERAFIVKLTREGLLAVNCLRDWDDIADVDSLIAAERSAKRSAEPASGAAAPSSFRRPSILRRGWGTARGGGACRSARAHLGQPMLATEHAIRAAPSADPPAAHTCVDHGNSRSLLSRSAN
jgi:hypothetical protein